MTSSFKVIKGGRTDRKYEPTRAHELNIAVLQLPLAELGLTVEQALNEYAELYYLPDKGDRQHRIARAFVGAGLRLCTQGADALARPVYLTLANSQRMLAAWPSLRSLDPASFEGETFG